MHFNAKCDSLIHTLFLLLETKAPKDQRSDPTIPLENFFVHTVLQMLFLCCKVEKYMLDTWVQWAKCSSEVIKGILALGPLEAPKAGLPHCEFHRRNLLKLNKQPNKKKMIPHQTNKQTH